MEDFQETLSTISSLPSSSSLPNPDPLSIDGEIWLMAEKRTREILCAIQPTVDSEKARKEVIDYVRRLIQRYYATEVFPFGSVPLKTYLPDGDIDLTVISDQNVEEDLARGVCSILEGGDKDSKFQVKDVQYICAQVKVVKCIVKNIAVDISFNQLAGLSSLCFLEQVDQIIGRDHLFKRSIILIKAWCYYEARILGAHHGLFSAYALETLVLCIINRYHSSLRGPLEVLYRFLVYFSAFDWDSYCVSVSGPLTISLPGIGVTTEENRDELLLTEVFLRNCREIFSVPIRAHETRIHEFPIKHLNIVDPLKDNNNLGRSVSKGNFHRIRCALSYGAQKLREVLMLPGESMGEGLENFFTTILNRNGRGLRPDIQVPIPTFGTGRSRISDLSGDYDSYYGDLQYSQQYHDYTLFIPGQSSSPSSLSHVWNKTRWESMAQSWQHNWNLFSQKGTEVYYPRLPFHCHDASQLSAAIFPFEDMKNSRGTGTYIPNLAHNSYEDIPRVRGRYSKHRTQDFMRSHKRIDRIEVPSVTDNGANGCCFNLSNEEFPLLASSRRPPPSEMDQTGQLADLNLSHEELPQRAGIQKSPPSEVDPSGQLFDLNLSHEEFPLLAGIQKPPSSEMGQTGQLIDQIEVPSVTDKVENDCLLNLSLEEFPLLTGIRKSPPSKMNQSGQLTVKSPKAKDCSPSGSIRFGTHKCSPSPLKLPLQVMSKQADSSMSSVSDLMQVNPTMGMQRQQRFWESDDNMVLMHQYHLKDDKEFPPLTT
ncbi:hypothetical protein CMV_009749 [Castanea mollissima]|uniref:Polymerase nucleotidyl transferase domain-containing protein n=1 Tax=Castanea mollissima TaxID=60419 RepID=A0A8J4W193_9ROSI|nr:hypothetical protein CMV_009749 [Castanea mollissima]